MKVLREFEAAVRAHAFIGALESMAARREVEDEYKRARAAILKALLKKETEE